MNVGCYTFKRVGFVLILSQMGHECPGLLVTKRRTTMLFNSNNIFRQYVKDRIQYPTIDSPLVRSLCLFKARESSKDVLYIRERRVSKENQQYNSKYKTSVCIISLLDSIRQIHRGNSTVLHERVNQLVWNACCLNAGEPEFVARINWWKTDQLPNFEKTPLIENYFQFDDNVY